MSTRPPFFITGTQRSGTTLLQQILDSHSQLEVKNELYWFYPYARGEETKRSLVDLFVENTGVNNELFSSCDKSNSFELLDAYFANRLKDSGKEIWGLKDPHLSYALDEFRKAYPNARFLFTVRDPRAVVNSYLERRFNVANAYHGAKLWATEVSLQRQFCERFPDRTRIIRYEELVQDKIKVLRGVCDFLEIEYEEEMGNYFKSGPSIPIHKGTANVTKDVDPRIADKWKGRLTASQLKVISSVAGATASKNGYELASTGSRIGPLRKVSYDIHQWLVTTYIWQKKSGWSGIRRRLRLGD